MYVLKKDCGKGIIAYLKYEGWHIFSKGVPLDLNGCILFTKSETILNPPLGGEEYQHWGCYAPIKEENHDDQ